MTITSIDLGNQVAVAQLAFAIMLVGFALFILAFGRLEKRSKERK